LEAMAAKTPVIVTRTGGALFLVKDGQTGYLVHTRNAQEIADRVNFLLEHDDLRKKIGEKAQKIVADRFTWDKLAEKFIDIYKKYSYTSREYLRLVKVNYPQKIPKK
jgi:glycosyltransferase involved in cell wall biosynthesis